MRGAPHPGVPVPDSGQEVKRAVFGASIGQGVATQDVVRGHLTVLYANVPVFVLVQNSCRMEQFQVKITTSDLLSKNIFIYA